MKAKQLTQMLLLTFYNASEKYCMEKRNVSVQFTSKLPFSTSPITSIYQETRIGLCMAYETLMVYADLIKVHVGFVLSVALSTLRDMLATWGSSSQESMAALVPGLQLFAHSDVIKPG